MLFLLSPAKSLDYDTPPVTATHTQPAFLPQAQALIDVLREKTPQDIAALMHLSDPLAGLNVARYQAWKTPFNRKNAKQAVLAFNGDVYEGLNAPGLSQPELEWAQQHICILSGLYGVLRPLDLMQPYRLEMGTRLATPQGSNLYRYWGATLANYLNQRAAADKTPVVVNLASEEYFKAVDRKVLRPRVIQCVFEEGRNGQYKVISFFAKRARGLMARHAVTQRVTTVAQLQSFDAEGYHYAPEASTLERLVFRRAQTS